MKMFHMMLLGLNGPLLINNTAFKPDCHNKAQQQLKAPSELRVDSPRQFFHSFFIYLTYFEDTALGGVKLL